MTTPSQTETARPLDGAMENILDDGQRPGWWRHFAGHEDTECVIRPMHLASLLDRAVRTHGNRLAIRFQNFQMTYSRLHEAAERFAEALRLRGVKPGQRVARCRCLSAMRRQPRLHRVGRLGGRRISGRYRRGRHGDRLGWHRLCLLFHGDHGRGSKLTGDQQQERRQSAQLQHQRKDQLSFHRISGSIPHWAIRRLSQLPRKYTIRNTAAAIAQLMG